jgi:dipeptidase E
MRLLLLSWQSGALAPFLADGSGDPDRRLTVGYVTDAQAGLAGAPFVAAERSRMSALGHDVREISGRNTKPDQLDAELAALDALYVASGSTFALLEALKTTGNDAVIIDHVRAGLPYIGTSAGSIIAGPDIAPASLMDDPADGPLLRDTRGLALVDTTVIPHADGLLPPCPPELIDRIVETYGVEHRLQPLRDDQALLFDARGTRVIASGE